mmetsp:Transcript_16867/g.37957  ORF Transcript_16867/g.37957 Transcript_16867/m.37957 type:complete len:540 (-) Transcript_16867:424-2043(-)
MALPISKLLKSDVIIAPAKSIPGRLGALPGNLQFQLMIQNYVNTGLCIGTINSIQNSAREIVQKIHQLEPCGRFFRLAGQSVFLVDTSEALQYTAIALRKSVATSTLLKLSVEFKSAIDGCFSPGKHKPNQSVDVESENADSASETLSSELAHKFPSRHKINEKSTERPNDNVNHYSFRQPIFPIHDLPRSHEMTPSFQDSFHIATNLRAPVLRKASNISKDPPTRAKKVARIDYSLMRTSIKKRFYDCIDNNVSLTKSLDRKLSSPESQVSQPSLRCNINIVDTDNERIIPCGDLPIPSPDIVSSSCTLKDNCGDFFMAEIRKLQKPSLMRIVTDEDEENQGESRPKKRTVREEEVFPEPNILNMNDVLVGWPEELEEKFCGNIQFRHLVSSTFQKNQLLRAFPDNVALAGNIYDHIRKSEPPGRFLYLDCPSKAISELTLSKSLSYIAKELSKVEVALSFLMLTENKDNESSINSMAGCGKSQRVADDYRFDARSNDASQNYKRKRSLEKAPSMDEKVPFQVRSSIIPMPQSASKGN